MRWRIVRTLRAPATALPVQERTWPCELALGRPLFALQPVSAEDEVSRTLGQMLDEPALSVRWEGNPTWENLPPPPWLGYLNDEDSAALIGDDLGESEIAFALRLLPVGEWRRRQPLNGQEVHAALLAGGPLPQRLREAFAFALFEPNGPWDPNDELMTGWTQAVRAVLYQRRSLPHALQPKSPWLALGYRLLDTVSRLRATRPTLADVEAGWRDLQPPDGHRLPFMFAVVYWGEGAYRMSECGDSTGAAAALARQTAAADALIELLPDLTDALDGGLWRHHLGQLAYYRGDFPEALRQFQQEWRLQAQRPVTSLRGRLQRSLSNVLTDMGLLASAGRIVETALAQQRASDDPELFKTLGRIGEIRIRLGDYPAARAAYEESWQRQVAQREGRTAVYLGHLALLEQEFDQADAWYQTAEQADRDQGIAFNPYLLMGRIALAQRRRNRGEVLRWWALHKDELDVLHDEKVLPAAVAALAAALVTPDANLAGQYIERLLDTNYFLEALCPLVRLAPEPRQVEQPWLRRIAAALRNWQRALNHAARDITDLDPKEMGAPGPVAARIEQALKDNDWSPLADDVARAFPMNLLG